MASGIILDYDMQPSKVKKRSLLDEYDELELEEPAMSFNKFRPSEIKKEKETSELAKSVDEDEIDDDWLGVLSQWKTPKVKTHKNYRNSDVFDFLHGESGKKKKKKKKEKEGPKDYYDDFAPEIGLMRNMLEDATKFTDSLQKRYYALESTKSSAREQSRFTSSLQKRYDTLESTKSSARGVGKFTTDLISSINQSRSVSSQLLNNITSLKKSIADLNMKERKEAAAANGGDGEDLSNFSASFLRKLIQQDRSDAAMYGDAVPISGDEDDIFDNISELLADNGRSDEVDKYLKYENRNVELVAYVDPDTDAYEIKAIAEDGEELYDYPIPEVERMDINHSTEIATDEYHTRYRIIWTK